VGRQSFGQLVGNLPILRGPLERSLQGSRSAAMLLQEAGNHPRLQTVRVGEVMSKPVQTLPLDLPFAEAVRRAQEFGKGAYPVVDAQGEMAGLCTRTDFYNALQRLCPRSEER